MVTSQLQHLPWSPSSSSSQPWSTLPSQSGWLSLHALGSVPFQLMEPNNHCGLQLMPTLTHPLGLVPSVPVRARARALTTHVHNVCRYKSCGQNAGRSLSFYPHNTHFVTLMVRYWVIPPTNLTQLVENCRLPCQPCVHDVTHPSLWFSIKASHL